MSAPVDPIDALAEAEDSRIVHVSLGAVGAINKSEVEAQLDAAHKYKRSITSFLREASQLATITREVAESCIYTLKRGGKMISGPSVRLAEICASAYGNLHVGARVVDVEDREIVAQGIAWDLEKNLRVTIETRRRITKSNGTRYDDDMIMVTGNAASSIALRNAVFRVVPRSYVDSIYNKVKAVAVGDAKTLATRRAELLDRLQKLGVSQDRVLARLEKKGVEDIGLDEMELLIGLGTAIRNGEQQIDDAFPEPPPPPVPAGQDGKRVSLRGTKSEQKEPESPPQGREPGSDG